MSVNFKDNSGNFLAEFNERVTRANIRVGLHVVSSAVQNLSNLKEHSDGTIRPNVNTGLLRNSITFALDGEMADISHYSAEKPDSSGYVREGKYTGIAPEEKFPSVYVGTNVEYAISVEKGGHKSRAYPFLKPAITENIDVIKRIYNSELKK